MRSKFSYCSVQSSWNVNYAHNFANVHKTIVLISEISYLLFSELSFAKHSFIFFKEREKSFQVLKNLQLISRNYFEFYKSFEIYNEMFAYLLTCFDGKRKNWLALKRI